MFWLYHADYLVPDLRSGGEVLYNRMTMPLEPAEMIGIPHLNGLTVSDKLMYHVVPDAKLVDLVQRTIDKNPVPCIIPFSASLELNSLCWIELRKQLESNNIKFLVSVQDRQTEIEDDGSYFKMTSEEVANDLLPFGQTDALVQEAVNLKTEYKNDKIKLVEPRTGTKDRIVILSYVNYIMSLIENEWLKQQQRDSGDWDDFDIVY